ncbi:MAG: DNA methyltransferase [Gammaproteobacteria bacterium]
MPNHWRIGRPKKAEKVLGKHPTQKPLELLDRIIRCASNPGDLVLA